MKDQHSKTLPVEKITFLPDFTPFTEKFPMYEGLWDNWKRCGFTLFHEEIVHEIDKFFHDPQYSSKDFNYSFISTFIFYLNEYYDVDRAFLESGGLTTRYGIIWIRYKIQDFYSKYARIPTPKELLFIRTHLESADYSKYGYSSWERLIAQNLAGSVITERWKGTVGLHEAKRRIISFYDLHGKPPCAHQFPIFYDNCRKGLWKPQGIVTWRDFLSHVFQKKLRTYYNRTWDGALGLQRARRLLYKQIDIHGLIPARETFHSGVTNSLKDGLWIPFGIHSWIDFLWTIHGLTYEQIYRHFTYSKRRYTKKSWKGLDGLTDAMVVLSAYHDQHKKYPTSEMFPTIARMCRNRRWKRWKVVSWEDLMGVVFGKG